jgi:hypothetical protein
VEQKNGIEPLCPKIGGMLGEAINCGPARSASLFTGAAAVATSPWLGRVAVRTAACVRPGTPARVRGGLGKCHGIATCVHDRAPCQRPDGKRGNSSAPDCDPTSGVVHGTPAGRTGESAKKFLLRDHAPPQRPAALVLVAKRWRADGAHVRPRRAGLWPPRPGVARPAAAPPANASPTAGIRDPGSNAGSNAVVGTCVHSLCAGRRASAVVGNNRLAYHDDGPRERILPRDSPG